MNHISALPHLHSPLGNRAARSAGSSFTSNIALAGLLVFAGYYVGAKVGFALTFHPHPVSVLWPPNAILLAALLLTPKRAWWILLLAAFPAHWLAQLQSHVPPRMIFCWFVSNSCEALIGAGCIRYLIEGPVRLDRLRNVAIFCFGGVFLGPFLSSFLDCGFVALNHWGVGSYWEIWRIRFTSNVLAALTITPLIGTWAAQGITLWGNIPRRKFLEGSCLLLGLFVTSFVLFNKIGPGADSALFYVPLPFLLWAAVRFGSRGATAAIAAVAFLAIWGVAHGHGPFSENSAEANALSVQVFLIFMSLPLLFLAALIEERDNTEETLRESEQRLDLAASGGGLGLWVWDIARNRIWINDNGQSLFGFAPSEKIDIDQFRNRIHPEDRELVRAAAENSLSTGAEYEIEYRIVLPNGQVRWIHGRGRIEFKADGKPARMHGVSIDITERKQTEEALRESEVRFRTMANTAPVMIWMSGTDKLCTFFNKRWLDFTGRTLEQELGNGWAEGVHREDFDYCFEVYVNSFDARQPFTMEYRLRRSDGEYGWVLDSGTPHFAVNGAFIGYIGSAIDITQRKQAEQETQQMRREIAHVGRVSMMGQLASALAHEINQPLGAILRNAEAAALFMQNESPDLDEIRAILADIRKDDQRAGAVIDRMRALLKRHNLATRPLEVGTLVGEVAALVRADAVARHVKLEVNVSPGLPPVNGDRVHLQQVLLNLILNGMDALNGTAPDDRRVTVCALLDGSQSIEIAIKDSGPGVPADELAHVFDPFFTTKPNGMGMGLPISRTIIEAHGGRLWAENNKGRGATFRFTLQTAKDAGVT